MGLKGGAERVPDRFWGGLVPFFHEEVLAFEFELGVRAARGGLGIVVGEQVLGCYRERVETPGAQKEQHGVWEGVKGEVSTILRGRPRLEPWKGEAAARVSRAENPVGRRVAVEGRSLQGEREPCGRRVYLRGGAHDPEVRQASFVREEEVERREAGLDGQDVRRGGYEAVGDPSLDLVPEHCQFPKRVYCGHKDVRAVAENGEEEGGGQSMAEKGGRPIPGGERRFTATKAAWALASLLTKGGVVAIEGVNQ